MLLDSVLAAYVSALVGGFAVLHVYSLPILGVVSHLAFLRGMLPQMRAGIHPGEVWAHMLLMVLSIVGYIFLLTHFRQLSLLIFELASFFGAQVGGLSGNALMAPSTVMEAGRVAVAPLTEFVSGMSAWEQLKNLGTLLQFTLVSDLVLLAFVGIAINVTLTVIEFHFAVLVATVLLPWAPLGPTAFLAEFSLGWVVGMAVRLLAQTALIGVSIPLFETLVLTLTPVGNPDFWGAVGVVAGAILFFLLSWLLPNRSAGLLARGLAITGSDVVAGAASAARGVAGFGGAASRVVSGVSHMLRQERG